MRENDRVETHGYLTNFPVLFFVFSQDDIVLNEELMHIMANPNFQQVAQVSPQSFSLTYITRGCETKICHDQETLYNQSTTRLSHFQLHQVVHQMTQTQRSLKISQLEMKQDHLMKMNEVKTIIQPQKATLSIFLKFLVLSWKILNGQIQFVLATTMEINICLIYSQSITRLSRLKLHQLMQR